ncbi:hypothetical protein MMC10_005341 [Thelotrema lepadinum]|nr:hypothetical protein [Thelotrema lepadinum]
MDPAPAPKSLLGRHRLLSPTASVRVSPLCLGAMNFGDAWEDFLGKCDKDTAFSILDHFFESGGNFIDTANGYQAEQSEQWLGEWMTARGNRDQIVLATKYTSNYQTYKGFDKHIPSNFGGNGSKSLHLSVRDSLKKLQTDYVDVLYVHWWDFTTSIPEIMLSLNDLCRQGKVLYLGASDLPAYIVSKANQYARDHGLRQFVVYQGRWSASNRDFERDILSVCREDGMALAPWGALGGGSLKTQAQREAMEKEGEKGRMVNPRHVGDRAEKVSAVLENIAERKKTVITSVAMAYVMHKAPYVFPIVGGRKLEHLKGNIEALGLELSEEDMKEIDNAAPFDPGFPYNTFGRSPEENWLLKAMGTYDYVKDQQPIKPQKL